MYFIFSAAFQACSIFIYLNSESGIQCLHYEEDRIMTNHTTIKATQRVQAIPQSNFYEKGAKLQTMFIICTIYLPCLLKGHVKDQNNIYRYKMVKVQGTPNNQ